MKKRRNKKYADKYSLTKKWKHYRELQLSKLNEQNNEILEQSKELKSLNDVMQFLDKTKFKIIECLAIWFAFKTMNLSYKLFNILTKVYAKIKNRVDLRRVWHISSLIHYYIHFIISKFFHLVGLKTLERIKINSTTKFEINRLKFLNFDFKLFIELLNCISQN